MGLIGLIVRKAIALLGRGGLGAIGFWGRLIQAHASIYARALINSWLSVLLVPWVMSLALVDDDPLAVFRRT